MVAVYHSSLLVLLQHVDFHPVACSVMCSHLRDHFLLPQLILELRQVRVLSLLVVFRVLTPSLAIFLLLCMLLVVLLLHELGVSELVFHLLDVIEIFTLEPDPQECVIDRQICLGPPLLVELPLQLS